MPHVSDQHDRHDPLLVVSLAAGDLAGTDRDRATSLVSECADCARLHDDLLAIARATAALPAAASPRDFRITPEQAARLRPGGWRRFVAALGAPRLSRQLGVGMATLGLAGLLLSALPPLQINLGAGSAGASMSAEQRELTPDGDGSTVFAPASNAAASQLRAVLPGSEAAAPSPSTGYYTMSDRATVAPSGAPVRTSASGKGGTTGVAGGAQSTRDATTPGADRLVVEVPASESGGASLLVIVSGLVLAIGVILLVARRIAGPSAVR